MLVTERDLLARQEYYADLRCEAEAHRLRKQLPQRRRNWGLLTRMFTWLGNRTVRFGYFLGADIRAASITEKQIEFA